MLLMEFERKDGTAHEKFFGEIEQIWLGFWIIFNFPSTTPYFLFKIMATIEEYQSNVDGLGDFAWHPESK